MKAISAAAQKAALIFLGVCLALGLAEAALRFLPAYRFAALASQVFQWDHCSEQPRYRPSRLLGYELIPNGSPDVNSFGMRDKEYARQKPARTFRILLLGDSICELGHWSDYLEDLLQKNGSYEILNCGTSAWGLNHYYLYLKNRGLQFQPDFVLLGLCLNDVDSTETPVIFADQKNHKTSFCTVKTGPTGSEDITLRVNPSLFRISALYRLVALRLLRQRRGPAADDVATLTEMRRLAKDRIGAVVFPYLKPLPRYAAGERRQHENTLSYLRQAGIAHLDLTPHFNRTGHRIAAFRRYRGDQIHCNDEADRLQARWILPWILDQTRD